jgi:plastocyanin
VKRALAGVLVCALLFAACSGGDDDTETSNATKASDLEAQVVDLRGKAEDPDYPEIEVAVKDNEFIEPAIRIDPGVTVEWVNEGRSPHDIHPFDERAFGDDEFGVDEADFQPGDVYEYQFDTPGVYRYFCHLHGSETVGMVGLIVVGDVDVDSVNGETTGGTVSGTLRVPEDYPTIQAAVDAAKAGSLVLIAPGTYKEAVTVTTEDLVIRGLDRNTTIVDGEFTRENGFKVLADGVAIENITAQNFTHNGFFWTGVHGYRGSYLNAIRNGDYGIYAFDSTLGRFDNDYASGSPDAGFYIGQCTQCDAVITDVLAEWNGIGYSGTNAGGNLFIVNSTWRENRVGIVPNSGTGEANPPQRESVIAGNRVYSNNNAQTAAIDIAQTATYNGILLAGGNENLVVRNLVYDHDLVGIAPVVLPEKLLDPDNPKAQNFDARDNTIRDNVVRDNRAADLALVTSIEDPDDAGGNCFENNTYSTSLPADIETLAPCDGNASAFTTDVGRFLSLLGAEKPAPADYKTVPLPDPGEQPQMPKAATAKAEPASRLRAPQIDVEDITLPS